MGRQQQHRLHLQRATRRIPHAEGSGAATVRLTLLYGLQIGHPGNTLANLVPLGHKRWPNA